MGDTNNVWKWIAAILATVLLAGTPGYVNLYLRSPSRDEVNLIRERQNTVLERLAVIDVRLSGIDGRDQAQQDELVDLRQMLSELRQQISIRSGSDNRS